MNRRIVLTAMVGIVLVGSIGWAFFQSTPAAAMTDAANKYLAALTVDQRKVSQLDYENEGRVKWHFIPLAERKGLQIKEMNEAQRAAAHALLRSALSATGNDKATKIMSLEIILRALEQKKSEATAKKAEAKKDEAKKDDVAKKDEAKQDVAKKDGAKKKGGGNIRDPERYYFTVFGKPEATGKWGLSVEGHHLSLNFVVENGRVISNTPMALGTNPATVRDEVAGGQKVGTRLLAKEEERAFELLASLNPEQRKTAVISETAVNEVRAAGEAQPPKDPPAGIPAGKLNDGQKKLLSALIDAYAENVPEQVAQDRWAAIRTAGLDQVHFAWAGADKPGVGHYYRVQGPTFLIEFVNTQSDAAGNRANHIHLVWRDVKGDFAIPIK